MSRVAHKGGIWKRADLVAVGVRPRNPDRVKEDGQLSFNER
ncbi:MAG: hypothetical protein JWO13_3653 [Acidobacteriales bacterium]|nr:hypothetical protein [Terriglobales bacterium]